MLNQRLTYCFTEPPCPEQLDKDDENQMSPGGGQGEGFAPAKTRKGIAQAKVPLAASAAALPHFWLAALAASTLVQHETPDPRPPALSSRLELQDYNI